MSAGRKDRTEQPVESSPIDSPFDKPVVLPIQEECTQAHFYEVRIVHGKGTGIQRNIIRSILEKHPAVVSFQDAPPEAGGWGATIVTLRKQD